jgi:hypothetical protein
MQTRLQDWPLRVRVEQSTVPKTALVTITSAESLQVRLSPSALVSVHDAMRVAHCLRHRAAPSAGHECTGPFQDVDRSVQSLFTLQNCTGLAIAVHRSLGNSGAGDVTGMNLSPHEGMQPLSFTPRKELVHLPDLARKVCVSSE